MRQEWRSSSFPLTPPLHRHLLRLLRRRLLLFLLHFHTRAIGAGDCTVTLPGDGPRLHASRGGLSLRDCVDAAFSSSSAILGNQSGLDLITSIHFNISSSAIGHEHLSINGAYHIQLRAPLVLGSTLPGRSASLTIEGATQPDGLPIVVTPDWADADLARFPAARHSWADGTAGGNVTLRDLSFVGFGAGNGDGDGDGEAHAALLARLPRAGMDSLTLERCTVNSSLWSGVVVDSGGGSLTLVASAVTGSMGGHGIHSKGDFRGAVEVHNSVVSGCAGNGVLVEGAASRLTVSNSTVGSTSGVGAIRSAAAATTISTSYVGVARDGSSLPNLHGVYLDSSAVDSTVVGTVVGNSVRHGIWTNAASTSITSCLVGIGRDNGHTPNGGNGVRSAVPHTVIRGTIIGNSGGHAINADGTHTETVDSFLGVTPAGMHIPNGGAGIRHGSSSAMNIIRNSVIGNARGAAGIDASASQTTIEDSFFGVTPGVSLAWG